jgi:hypothetical protein
VRTSFLLFCVAAALLTTSFDSALAGSASSCAVKFIGSYMVTVRMTGQTYPTQVLPGGIAHDQCPMCNPTGSWTCSGDTITFSINGITETFSPSPNLSTLIGPCCILRRLGAAPSMAATSPQPAQQQPPSPPVKKKVVGAAANPTSCPDDVGPGMLLTNPGISLEGSSGCNKGSATQPQLPGALSKGELPDVQGRFNPQNRAPEVPGVSSPNPPLISDNTPGAAPQSCPQGQTYISKNLGCQPCKDWVSQYPELKVDPRCQLAPDPDAKPSPPEGGTPPSEGSPKCIEITGGGRVPFGLCEGNKASYTTWVRISRPGDNTYNPDDHCPKSMDILYDDPAGGHQTMSIFQSRPAPLDTCGGPAINIRPKP